MIKFGEGKFELFLEKAKFDKSMKATEARLGKLRSGFLLLATAATVFGAAGLAAMGNVTNAAGDAEESLNRFRAVFGDLADDADAFAHKVAKSIGRMPGQIRDGMAQFQNVFLGLEFGRKEAAKFSKQMIQAALDFASFNNISDEEAVDRFRAALTGSAEVLDQYGINVKATALDQVALKNGIQQTQFAGEEQYKTFLRMTGILQTMGRQGAMGDAEKTADSYVNQLKRLNAQVEQAKIALGQGLMPVVLELLPEIIKGAEGVAEWVRNNQRMITTNAEAVVELAKLMTGFSDFSESVAGYNDNAEKTIEQTRQMAEDFDKLFHKVTLGIGTFAQLAFEVAKLNVQLNKANKLTDDMANAQHEYDKSFVDRAIEAEVGKQGAGRSMIEEQIAGLMRDRKFKLGQIDNIKGKSLVKMNEKALLHKEVDTLNQRVLAFKQALADLQSATADRAQQIEDEAKNPSAAMAAAKKAGLFGLAAKLPGSDTGKGVAVGAGVEKGRTAPHGESFLQSLKGMIENGTLNAANIADHLKEMAEGANRRSLVQEIAEADSPGEIARLIERVKSSKEETERGVGANTASEIGTAETQRIIREALTGRKQKDQVDLLEELVSLAEDAQDFNEQQAAKKKDELEITD